MAVAVAPSPVDSLFRGRDAKRTRNTTQQRCITRVLLNAQRPLSVMEIHAEASQEVPKLGIATIYRVVAELQQRGQIRQVLLPKDSPRYEPARLAGHEYFRCIACNRVHWVFSAPPKLSNMVPDGFEMDGHQVVLYGTCAACAR